MQCKYVVSQCFCLVSLSCSERIWFQLANLDTGIAGFLFLPPSPLRSANYRSWPLIGWWPNGLILCGKSIKSLLTWPCVPVSLLLFSVVVARYILFCCLYSVSVCIILVYFGLYPALMHTSRKSYVVVTCKLPLLCLHIMIQLIHLAIHM